MSHIHVFEKSEFKDYERCIGCGSYHSTAPKNPKILYEEEDYWSEQHGHSTPQDQIYNLTETKTCGISKIDAILKYVPIEAENILEIGCCPGELLKILSEEGFNVTGIEPAWRHIEFISNNAPKAKVIKGYFPKIFSEEDVELFDCVIFMDVFEHIEDYDMFIKAVYRLLTKGGIAICMSPIIFEDGLFRERDMKADEHIWIHHINFLKPYLEEIFDEVKFSDWIVGHELIILKK